MKSDIDCVIVGSGVAGMTAAIYLKRANINVVVIEKMIPGGQINKTANIENYPGFNSIEGPILASKIFEQMKKLDINYKYGNVLDIIDHGDYKLIKTDLEEIICKSVIIATGRVPRMLGLKNEEELIGKGISFCAICDGFFYKDKTVAVVGGGNSSLEESLYLSKICKEVNIIHRKDKFTAENYLQEKVNDTKNIKIFYNSFIKEIIKNNNNLDGIIINNDEKLNVDGLFIYIGQDPDLSSLGSLKLDLDGNYIIVNQHMQTSINGIYACGDVVKKDVYQITTALSDATIAAGSVKKYVQN